MGTSLICSSTTRSLSASPLFTHQPALLSHHCEIPHAAGTLLLCLNARAVPIPHGNLLTGLDTPPRPLLPTFPGPAVSELPRQCLLSEPFTAHSNSNYPLPILLRISTYSSCSSHLPSSSSLTLPPAEPLPFHCVPAALRHSLPNHLGMVLAQKKMMQEASELKASNFRFLETPIQELLGSESVIQGAYGVPNTDSERLWTQKQPRLQGALGLRKAN